MTRRGIKRCIHDNKEEEEEEKEQIKCALSVHSRKILAFY
jgi:hypothetical protein